MAKDVLETEHRSPREVDPDVNELETQSVPRLREVKEQGTNPTFAPTVFVDPESVVPAADPDPQKPRKFLLKPVFPTAPYKVHVFQHGLKGFVPTRIAAVVPGGLREFNRAIISIHCRPSGPATRTASTSGRPAAGTTSIATAISKASSWPLRNAS